MVVNGVVGLDWIGKVERKNQEVEAAASIYICRYEREEEVEVKGCVSVWPAKKRKDDAGIDWEAPNSRCSAVSGGP